MTNEIAKQSEVALIKLPEKRIEISETYCEQIKKVDIDSKLKTMEVDMLVEDGNNLLVRGCITQEDAAEYAATIANSTKLARQLDKSRLDFGKNIRKDLETLKNIFDENIGLLNGVVNKLNKQFVKFQEEEAERERKRLEEEQRKAEEAARIKAEEEQRLAEEEAKLQEEETLFDDEEPEEVEPTINPEPIAAVETKTQVPVFEKPIVKPAVTKTESGTVKIIEKVSKVIVTDISKVPDEFKEVNTSKVTQAWNDGRKFIPGIQFEIEKTTQTLGGKSKK